MYNTSTETSYFYGPTTIISKDNYIYCERGWYNTAKDISEFRKNAYMRNKRQTLAGDSIYYEQRTGLGLAYHNVTITDSIEHVLLQGQYGVYDQQKQYSVVTDQAMMIQVDGADSLFLHADTLRATFDTTDRKAKVLFAYHKAKFFRSNLQGMCDSLIYHFSDSTITLYNKPILWSEDKQLTADTIVIHTANRQIDSLSLHNAGFVITIDDSTLGRYNQVKGINIKACFTNGEISRVYVYEKSETIYYLREDNGKKIGINKATGRNVIISFKGNEIASISFLEKPEGTMFPDGGLGEAERYLRNFEWKGQHRPLNKYDIFRWL
jgi:lipopolysaccharide export system protein LptA